MRNQIEPANQINTQLSIINPKRLLDTDTCIGVLRQRLRMVQMHIKQ